MIKNYKELEKKLNQKEVRFDKTIDKTLEKPKHKPPKSEKKDQPDVYCIVTFVKMSRYILKFLIQYQI